MCVMNKNKKSILIAMSIGDGCISKDPNSKSCYLSIVHSTKQEEWIKWKYDTLMSLLGGHYPKMTYFNNGGYPGIRFVKTSNYFRILRSWLYKNNKKHISRYLLNKLDAEGIAIWYMDDGNLSAKKYNGKIHAYELYLNTHISQQDNQIIIDYFKEVWDIQFHQVKNKGHYRLRMSTREIRKFLPIISKYIIPSMQYKIQMQVPQIRGLYKNS